MGVLELVALVLMVLAAVLSMALAPKPIPPAAAALSDFQVPTADSSRLIPDVSGTVLLKGPNVVWYGDLQADPIPAPGGKSGGGGGGGSSSGSTGTNSAAVV